MAEQNRTEELTSTNTLGAQFVFEVKLNSIIVFFSKKKDFGKALESEM